MLKVSVVVPTYQTPPEGLKRLVASLDRQTMPAEEFEVVFVDDGSPDDTPARLREIQETRPNVRVERIENSGWPSKPRNVGVDLARGEYIAFMDHDDELYPDALRAAHAFAVAHRSDVVNGKEARTSVPGWAIAVYTADEPQSIGNPDRHPLLPMNPHKLYRRDFLLAHGIRFPEGRKVMWEDIFFNVQVARHAQVISTLSTVPYYHWVTTEGSGSTTFVKTRDDYWYWLEQVYEYIEEQLAGDENRLQREQLLMHQYSYRVLGAFDLKYVSRSERNREFIFEHCRRLQAAHGMTQFDDRVGPSRRLRSELLQAGDRTLLEEVCRTDASVPGWGRARELRWEDGRLRVAVDIEWSDSQGRRPALERRDGRIHKVVSDEVRAAVTEAALDVTDDLAKATASLAVHSRRSRIAWPVPSETRVEIVDGPGDAVGLSARLVAELDPAVAALGAALTPATHWDLNLRAKLGNGTTQRGVRTEIPASVTVTGGAAHLIYPNDGGSATLIPGGQVEAVRRLTPVSAEAGADGEVRIRLSGVHDGDGDVATSVGVYGPRRAVTTVPAVLAVSAGVATLRVPQGSKRLRLRVGDRTPGAPLWWNVVRTREGVALTPGAEPPRPKPPKRVKRPAPTVGALVRRLRARAGGLLRRLGLRR
ncbi:glycosyltransferase [Microbacterium sp. PA5]|uniref:glycosyltransferase family 2 protein n=1 Tax=Microbacterium sp. PA5 TaxID=3416654 RepID=UPI003CF7655B